MQLIIRDLIYRSPLESVYSEINSLEYRELINECNSTEFKEMLVQRLNNSQQKKVTNKA